MAVIVILDIFASYHIFQSKRRCPMRIIVLTLLFFHSLIAMASDTTVRFEQWGVKQGMSQNSVLFSVQDHRGYLWFATQDGLNRFDGYEFKVFRHSPADSGSISDNLVNTLFVDSKGTLYAGTHGGGLNRYNEQTEQFTHYRHIPEDPHSISNNNVEAIIEDKNGQYWVGTESGLNRFDPDTGRFERFYHDPQDVNSLSSDFISGIATDDDGVLWIGTFGGGLNQFNPKLGRFVRYRFDSSSPGSLSNGRIWSVLLDSKGVLWISTLAPG